MISKEQIEQADKEELAVFAGIEILPKGSHDKFHQLFAYKYPDGSIYSVLPDFPHDLNACFRFIAPALQKIGWMIRVQWSPLFDNDTGKKLSDWTGYAHIYNIDRNTPLSRQVDYYQVDKEPATALCLAVLKLIKAGI